jgi:alkaline phosphatase D
MESLNLSRRRFLALGGAAGAVGTGAAVSRNAVAGMTRNFAKTASSVSSVSRHDPFTLGVASGDPWPHSVVLWTRLVASANDPDDTGIDDRLHEVEWQVASDPRLTDIERAGTALASPERAHALHVVVDGLRPGRDYWYRFRCGRWLSPIGRTKTAPHPGRERLRLDVAAASCQSWGAGYYTAHRHLAADWPDLVVFLGDYLYERAIDERECGRRVVTPLPTHLAAETHDLASYRARYAWYKSDPDLQAAHQASPWVATWDDHEVEDNYAAGVSGGSASPEQFAVRRAAAYQAYWEHLPLRVPPPHGASMTMHRRLTFGTLANIHVLDTRQHRSDQIAGAAWQRAPAERAEPRRTMLGHRQQRWLADGLARSTATWDIVAQQVIASHLHVDARDHGIVNVDTWDGYPAAQRLLYEALATAPNPVVLTGDLHAGYAFDIRTGGDETGAPIGAEFAATSISSGGDGADLSDSGRRFLDNTPHLHYANQRRGYLRCRLTPDELRVDFRVVPYVTGAADAPVRTDRSFVVESGARAVHAA